MIFCAMSGALGTDKINEPINSASRSSGTEGPTAVAAESHIPPA